MSVFRVVGQPEVNQSLQAFKLSGAPYQILKGTWLSKNSRRSMPNQEVSFLARLAHANGCSLNIAHPGLFDHSSPPRTPH